jgi:hypothetical protein
MTLSTWNLMREGKTDDGLSAMRDQYVISPTPSLAMQLGVGYLWAEKYEYASEHFLNVNKAHPRRLAATYGMEGVAKWCLGSREAATKIWCEGLRCEYTDGAGGVTIPLLLYFAWLMDATLISKNEVFNELAQRVKHPWIKNWPGPVAMFVAGQIDESQLEVFCVAHEKKFPGDLAQSLADFYLGLVALDKGDHQFFMEKMRSVANVSWETFDSNTDLFFSHVWCEYFYLSRCLLANDLR